MIIEKTSQHKILTIGVPTYNRAFYLKQFISFLIDDMGKLAQRVTVIISDNCSSDNTSSICAEYTARLGDKVDIQYCKQETNVGVSRNLVSLFYKCKTPYFMFLGDDDRLNADFFPELISILESKERPSAVIQAINQGRIRNSRLGFVEYKQAFHLFGEYGNAYIGIIDAKAAVSAIENRQLRESLEKIVWPQTAIGYLAMHDLQNRPVYLAPKEIGFPFVARTINIANRSYWVRSVYDLAMAAVIVDNSISGSMAKNSYVNHRSIYFLHGIAALTVAKFTEQNGESTARLNSLLKREFGWRGIPWRVYLFFVDRSVIFSEIVMGTVLFLLRAFNRNFKITVNSLKEDYRKRLEQFDSERDRLGDWF